LAPELAPSLAASVWQESVSGRPTLRQKTRVGGFWRRRQNRTRRNRPQPPKLRRVARPEPTNTASVHTLARYYEPTSGRFLSADPLGQAASPSLYDFAGGDPVNSFDPDGRCPLNQAQNNFGQNNQDPNLAPFDGQLGPLPTAFISPGVITPSPITNPGAGTTINVNGYGVLTITAAAGEGGQEAMTFTPNNGQDPSKFAYIQYITDSPTNNPATNQQSPYNGGGSVPYLDASVQYSKDIYFPDLPINSTGYYNDNTFNPSTPGVYNNGTPVYSNGSINFYDSPGPPTGAATFLVEKSTGTILAQVNWHS